MLRQLANFFVTLGLLLLSACAEQAPLYESAPTPAPPPAMRTPSKDYTVVVVQPGDTTRRLAAKHLGSPGRAWMIEDFNDIKTLTPGQEVVIPAHMPNAVGVYSTGYQVVPVLCYHRFGLAKNKMVVTPTDFADQMAYLAQNNYRVIPLADLADFLRGERALPRRSVVITMDDGYKSAYQYAYPILRRHGFPATIFVYTDFVGSREALSWDEMREMTRSRLIDIQPHSKTHANLGLTEAGETDAVYRERIATELKTPAQEIKRRLNLPIHTFAYPYGDSTTLVVEQLKQQEYALGVTVQPGTNAAFAAPYLLQRSMVFGDEDLAAFKKKLETFVSVDLR